MMALATTLLLASTSLILPPVAGDTSNIWLPNFTSLFWTSSAVTPDSTYLYIDGGEIWDGVSNSSKYGHTLGSTIAIDLSKPWTNASIPIAFHTRKPPEFPFARHPTVWYDSKNKALFSYGGANYAPESCDGGTSVACVAWAYDGSSQGQFFKISENPAPRAPLWQLQVGDDGLAMGSWKRSPRAVQPGHTAPPTSGSLSTTLNGELWNLGGLPKLHNYENYVVPGVIHFDGTTWTNVTSTPLQYQIFGGAVAASDFGAQGVIVLFGGYLSYTTWKSGLFPGDQHLRNMAQVSVLDIESGHFYTQHVSGSVPSPRHNFCAVGVRDEQGNLDIFVYGGQDKEYNVLRDIWVLSIPSFHWTQLYNPEAMAPPREEHTCEVIGNRQMVSIGGSDGKGGSYILPGKPDAFTNGIGVFDMSALAWTSRYDPNAKPYRRASSLAQILKQYKYPAHWTYNELAKLFVLPKSHNSSSSSSSSLSGGAIAGIVIGILALLLLIGLILFFFLRRRRRQQQHLQQKHELPTPNHNPTPGLPYSYYNSEKPLPPPRSELTGESAAGEMSDDQQERSELPSSVEGPAWEMRDKRDTLPPGFVVPGEGGATLVNGEHTTGLGARLNGDSGASTQVSDHETRPGSGTTVGSARAERGIRNSPRPAGASPSRVYELA